MKAGRLRVPLMLSAIFCGAFSVAWIAKLPFTGGSAELMVRPAEPVRVADPPPATDSDDVDFRIWLAGALVDADTARLKEIATSLVGNGEKKVWAAVFLRWFRVSPHDAWGFALDRPEGNSAAEIRLAALEQWAAIDPAAARAAVESPDKQEFDALVRGTKRVDIEAAFQLLGEVMKSQGVFGEESLPYLEGFGITVEDFAALGLKNPEMALALVELWKRGEYLGPVLQGWIQSDPAAAREWIESRPDGLDHLDDAFFCMSDNGKSYSPKSMDFYMAMMPEGNRKYEIANEAIESLAYVDPAKAVSELNRIFKDPDNRAEAIGKVASIVARENPMMAWDLLEGVDASSGIRRVQVPRVETGDAEADEDGGAPHSYIWDLVSMRGLVSPAEAKSNLLESLIEVDKDQAIRLMDRIPPGDFIEAGEYAMERWGNREPEQACIWLARKLGDQGDLDDLIFLSWISEMDRETLGKLSTELPSGTVRTTVQTHLAAQLAGENPQAAFEFARGQGAGVEVIDEIYNQWAETNPEQALEHVRANQDASPQAWDAVVENALKKFPEETARAVQSLPSGKTRDAAVSSIVDYAVGHGDPLSAADWAVTVGDGSMRSRAMEAMLARVGMDLRLAGDGDAVAALRKAISKGNGMSADEKGRWLKRIESIIPSRQ